MTPDPVVRSLSSQLRNLARLAAQWADVLESTERRESGDTLPEPKATVEAPSHPVVAAANSSAEPVPETVRPSGSTASTSTAPVIFACPMCQARTVWKHTTLCERPWPGAVCDSCYVELRMRRDEIQDAVVGYTGVR